jgi:hypothetical protein
LRKVKNIEKNIIPAMPPVPVVENIHSKILDAIKTEGNKLEMGDWHTCSTTHCRGGWAIFLAGDAGRELENKTNSLFAAIQIFKASSPIRVSNQMFFKSNDESMEDIIRCAKLEKESSETIK